MATIKVSAKQLKEIDERAFYKEYYNWCRYAVDHDWHEWGVKEFERDMETLGLYVSGVDWEEDYGWRATCSCNMRMDKLMEVLGHSESHFILYTAAKAYDMRVYGERYGGRRMSMTYDADDIDYFTGAGPVGVFSGMDPDEWYDLVKIEYNNYEPEVKLKEWLKDHLDALAKNLESEYEHLTSEESFIESCEINEMTFEVEGEDDED